MSNLAYTVGWGNNIRVGVVCWRIFKQEYVINTILTIAQLNYCILTVVLNIFVYEHDCVVIEFHVYRIFGSNFTKMEWFR